MRYRKLRRPVTKNASRRKLSKVLAGERLEDRRLLAVVLPEIGTGSIGSLLTNVGLTAALSSIPSSTLDSTPPDDISVLYHAFPQEANDVKVTGDLLNLFLYINEQNDDIFVQRTLPAFNDDLLEDFNFTLEFIAGVEIPVAHLLGLDFPDVEAIVPNPDALSTFIPSEVQQAFEAADQVLGTTIFPELEIFDTTIIPSLDVGDLIGGVIPGPVDDVLIKVIDILGGGSRGGVQLHLLDGNDTADLSELSGVVQEVHGGIGNDVLMGGGSQDPLDVLGVTAIAPPVNPRIELFGDEGRDKLIVNNRFDVVDYRVHGGAGNDILVVPGSDFNDIIRLVSDADGNLQRIEYLAPSSTGGLAQNEIQTVTLPAGATGTFTLTFDGQTTAPIAHNASTGDVESALEALSSISGVNVGGVPGAWTVEFDGAGLANTDQLNMAANGTGLTLIGGPVTVDPTLVGGSVNYNEIQQVALPAGTTGGQFALQLGAQITALLPANADSSAVRAALAALPGVGSTDNVMVTSPNPSGGPWDIEFTGTLSGSNQPQLTTVNSSLVGFAAGSSVATTTAGVLRVNEVQTVQVNAASGSYTHTFGGFTTSAIPVGASPLAIQNILAALPSIGPGNVSVTGAANNYRIEYVGALGGSNQPFIGTNTAGLPGGATITTSVIQLAVAGNDEVQTVTLDPAANGGSFSLTFNGETTSPISFDHSTTPATPPPASAVRAALGALPSINGIQNLTVTGAAGGPYTVTFVNDLGLSDQPSMSIDDSLIATPQNLVISTTRQGGTPVNDIQTISLPDNTSGGTFSLSVGGVPIPANLPSNATAAQVELVLEASPSINNVTVTGPNGGPWTVEFLLPNPGTPAPIITGNGNNLQLMGTSLNIAETQSGSAAGDQLLVTTTITELDGIEQLQIDLEGGDDRVIFQGVPSMFNDLPIFQQGIFVDGGDGTDVIEMQSLATTPDFQAPIFPDDVAATLQFDGRAIQFADVEGGLEFDAQGKAGTVLVSGTDASNDIRFRSLGGGEATFANDGQVTITLQNFNAPSTVNINAEQGEDTISIFLNGDSQFSQFNVNGDGPDGADALRIEGTANADAFVLTPNATDPKAGSVSVDGLVTIDYSFIDDLSFIGDGAVDSLTVNEPSAGSTDLVLFSPQVGNNGSFQWVGQPGGPETATVYAPVNFQGIETRVFNTGTGVDTFAASSDDLPGVNSSAAVLGGNGVTSISFGDQSTLFVHDTADEDLVSMEIGTAVDDVQITPGVGVAIAVNTALGTDELIYNAGGGNVTWNIADRAVQQPGVGDVTYTSVEALTLANAPAAASALTVLGTVIDEQLVYQPLTATGGRVEHSGPTTPVMTFDNFGGTFTVDGNGGDADVLTTMGTAGNDSMVVDMAARTVSLTDSVGLPRKPVTLAAGTEIAAADGAGGDDSVLVQAAAAATLQVNVIGGGPLASDRLVVQDVGPGDLVLHRESHDLRGGSVQVGLLPPIVYQEIERVDILPLDPISGGTGDDGNGRIVVFHADPFEQNDALVNATEVPDLFQSTVKANIGIAAALNAFDTGLDLPGDEDWYRFRAPKIGTYSFEVLFDRIAALPGGGELAAAVYRADGTLIADSVDFTNGDVVSFSADRLTDYYLRITGSTTDAINIYEVNLVEVDLVGPQVYDPDGAGPLQAIQITSDPTFNLFDLKGSDGQLQGPTPLVHSLTLNLRDILNRVDELPADLLNRAEPNGRAPGDLYPALDQLIAEQLGHFEVRGDNNGIIPIQSVRVVNVAAVVGQIPTATVELTFADPLPDDRFTLTIRDSLVDPAGNAFDGESNASEPNGAPTFPTGNFVSGGDFVARFTVDSRAEIGVAALGSAYIDSNGNSQFDPEATNSDDTNEDIVYKLGFQTDNTFAGNFVAGAGDTADGFDKLAAYGQVAGQFRWLIDTNNNGVPDLVVADPAQVNGRPVAGNFDGNAVNGDEVGLKDDTVWYLDADHDFQVDTTLAGDMIGLPIVGDFDGDGIDDLGAWADDVFSLDLSGVDGVINGFTDVQFTFGFPGVREIPVAADFNGDGVDDLGLYNPDAAGVAPGEQSDWMILLSQPNELVVLDQQFGFQYAGSQFFNAYGAQEKWFFDAANNWHFILPNGEVYGWDNTPGVAQGTLVGVVDSSAHANPDLLVLAVENGGQLVIPITDRIVADPQGVLGNVIDFTPEPFGPDLFASFGDSQALPIVGNFDPPVVPSSGSIDPVQVVGLLGTNTVNGHDVDGNGLVEPHDVLMVVNHLNRHGVGAYAGGLQIEADGQQWNNGPLPDVDGDGMIEPYDVLSVVNLLNRMTREQAAQGESQIASSDATARDAVFASWSSDRLRIPGLDPSDLEEDEDHLTELSDSLGSAL
ncbi:dockerin type I domain-containing protein [Roseimaritima ulvae]|uniref:Bifunctional hemolysin/adenylate cyclase n=1 Tax=Roseimaritima ulvae TaxID=980254 RepID=A0A5B9QXP3_9BACT|nr:dockerin type I domain-containing protein [Roseimaritima ulvae]QEG38731.1 hypothetical protein UC8_06890 [Roseimaritima ulvae]